jgi:Mg-chelatase subunit ChlI
MAVYKEGWFLVTARGFTFVFAAAALLVYTYQPAEGEFHATALG